MLLSVSISANIWTSCLPKGSACWAKRWLKRSQSSTTWVPAQRRRERLSVPLVMRTLCKHSSSQHAPRTFTKLFFTVYWLGDTTGGGSHKMIHVFIDSFDVKNNEFLHRYRERSLFSSRWRNPLDQNIREAFTLQPALVFVGSWKCPSSMLGVFFANYKK